MPNKTIYVADADLPVYDRAQELAGGNLSSTIAQALRRFVETEEARNMGFTEVEVKTGDNETYTRKQFLGRELARRRVRDDDGQHETLFTVYQTAKGRFAVYTRTGPSWWAQMHALQDKETAREKLRSEARAMRHTLRAEASLMREADRWRRWARDWSGGWNADPDQRDAWDWAAWYQGVSYRLDVYETTDKLRAHIPPELVVAVEQALRGDDVEVLDI